MPSPISISYSSIPSRMTGRICRLGRLAGPVSGETTVTSLGSGTPDDWSWASFSGSRRDGSARASSAVIGASSLPPSVGISSVTLAGSVTTCS